MSPQHVHTAIATAANTGRDAMFPDRPTSPVLSLRGTALSFGSRLLWRDLDLEVSAGEFIAVLGANGSGKTSLVKTILGQQQLDAGTIRFNAEPVRRGDRRIGYIPQQRLIPAGTPMRGRDLIAMGVDGHRFGLPIMGRAERAREDAIVADIGAAAYADDPVGNLSGGEQQRLRVGQALAGDPRLLVCDEPLLSLDLNHQRGVSKLIDQQRRRFATPVIFVTHDVNPVLDMVTRILYLAGGKFRVGTPDEVLQSSVLSDLYDTSIDVVRTGGRVIVVGTPDLYAPHHPETGT
jgi:zinc/manganese transport system ATP-binding protein